MKPQITEVNSRAVLKFLRRAENGRDWRAILILASAVSLIFACGYFAGVLMFD